MASSLTTTGIVAKPKRTRILNKSQSKNGCFTCKARRIKCDESWPTCQRCARSGRLCDGYPSGPGPETTTEYPQTPSTSHSLEFGIGYATGHALVPFSDLSPAQDIESPERTMMKAHFSPSTALYTGIEADRDHRRLADLGRSSLCLTAIDGLAPLKVWGYLIPQLFHSSPVINAAVAAFGASYQINVLQSHPSPAHRSAWLKQNAVAVRALRHGLTSGPSSGVAMTLACIILTAAEILYRHEGTALKHIQGAFGLYFAQRATTIKSRNDRPADEESNPSPDGEMDDINTLFLGLDIQAATYIRTMPPALPSKDFAGLYSMQTPIATVDDASAQLLTLIHACLHFTGKNHKTKYISSNGVGSDIFREQGKLIALLHSWQSRMEAYLQLQPWYHTFLNGTLSIDLDEKGLVTNALALRMQANSHVVDLACLLAPLQCDFDAYLPQFCQIVTDGTAILSLNDTAFSNKLTQFRLSPHIIEPLFHATAQCRHPVWRRRAVQLLDKAGIEGPWKGKLMANIGRRVIELEEAFAAGTIALHNPGGQAVELENPHPRHELRYGADYVPRICMGVESWSVAVVKLSPENGLDIPTDQYPPEWARLAEFGIDASAEVDGSDTGESTRRYANVVFHKRRSTAEDVLANGHWHDHSSWHQWVEQIDF